MALKDLFTAQTMNQMFPSRLPGTAYGWDTSSSYKEVCLDASVSAATEVLPTCPVKLVATSGQLKKVVPCTSDDDVVYGYVIYKAKNYINKVGANRMATVCRDMGEMTFAFKSTISAGDTVYLDPTDGFATSTSTDNIKVGIALEAVASASSSAPAVAVVEVQCARA